MVDIAIYFDKMGSVVEILVEGHAGVKGENGYEVCIAISTLSQAMVVALQNASSARLVKVNRKSGYLKFSCKTEKIEGYNVYTYAIVGKAFVDSLRDIAKQYDKFVNYKEYSNI